jgi:predicted porin
MLANADYELFGTANLSVNEVDSVNEIHMDSHESTVGLKGTKGLDSGFMLIYKIEFEIDISEHGVDGEDAQIKDGDQWLGIASKEYGRLRLGTISTPYKSSGQVVDPLYNTIFEGRGRLLLQSRLHRGAGPDGGRSENTARFDSPLISGASFAGHYALSERQGNTFGFGLHFSKGLIKLHGEYLKSDSANAEVKKLGGRLGSDNNLIFSFQYERGDDALLDPDVSVNTALDIDAVLMMNVRYQVKPLVFTITYGGHNNYNETYAIAADYLLAENSSVYAGFGLIKYDAAAGLQDDDILAAGVRHAF